MDHINKVFTVVKQGFKQISTILVALALTVSVAIAISVFIDYAKRSNDLKKSELSSKLLWNSIGQCFYVELDEMNKYYRIIRVVDCDKTK